MDCNSMEQLRHYFTEPSLFLLYCLYDWYANIVRPESPLANVLTPGSSACVCVCVCVRLRLCASACVCTQKIKHSDASRRRKISASRCVFCSRTFGMYYTAFCFELLYSCWAWYQDLNKGLSTSSSANTSADNTVTCYMQASTLYSLHARYFFCFSSSCMHTVEPLYNGHPWDPKFCPL